MPRLTAKEREQRRERKHYKWNVKSAIDSYYARFIDPIGAAETQQRVQARLQNPSSKTTRDAYDRRPPNGYYIVIGRGPAAVVNHTTLRQTAEGKKRLENDEQEELPVLHIGMPDPWLDYHEHGMGQPPYLLRLPGYHTPVAFDSATIHSGLSSRVFAQSTETEMDLLMENFEAYIAEGWAAAIQPRGEKIPAATLNAIEALGVNRSDLNDLLDTKWGEALPPYRVLVITEQGSPALAYGYKIDVCTGGGRMRLEPRAGEITPIPEVMKKALTPPWIAPDAWDKRLKNRLVVHGMDGMTEQTPWAPGDRILIYGAGGIALNQVERAKDVGCSLDWFAREDFQATFNLPRNDNVLKLPAAVATGQFMLPGGAGAVRTGAGTFNNAFVCYPGSNRWRFGRNSKLNGIAVANGKARPSVATPGGPTIADIYSWDQVITPLAGGAQHYPFSVNYAADNPHLGLPYQDGRAYDRVILCLGQDSTAIGEPMHLAGAFTFEPIKQHGRMVGLKDETNGDIRVLGAAATMWPQIMTDEGSPGYIMELYRQTLPMSAVVPGFILSCVNIAYANGYFPTATPNTNANTSSREELIKLFKAKGIDATAASEAAREIITQRSYPHNGFSNALDLANRVNAAPLSNLATWPPILALLSTDYRAAAPFVD